MRSESHAAVKQGGGAGYAVHVDAGGECWTEIVLRRTELVLVRLVTVTVLRGTAVSHHSSLPSTQFTAPNSGGLGARPGGRVLVGDGGGQHGGGGGGGGRGAAIKQLAVTLLAIEVQT